uniref:Uncharacterized protein n=1 Tax=Elaeophora elaphi TaxID=1147741 RepID=A0A0R3RIA8_9BILA
MKKSDESNNRSQEDSSTAVHGLRRFNLRQETSLSSNNTLRNCKGIEVSGNSRTMYQNGKIVDSWRSDEDDLDATYFWNHDDMERTKNDISLLRSVITSSYAGVEFDGSVNSSKGNHSRPDKGTAQRLQKIVPCGYAPNRFPVTVTCTPRPCWPKTCYGNPAYTFSGTITSPSTKIIPGSSSSRTQPTPSTSGFDTSSANEQIIYPKSPSTSDTGPNKKSQTLLIGLFHRFENETLDRRGGAVEGNSRRDALLIWLASKDKADCLFLDFGAFPLCSVYSFISPRFLEAKNVRNKPSKSASSRGKPHMPKFLQSFCCCIRPEATIKAKRRILHPVPSTSTPQSLITQVTKNSQNGTNVNGPNISVNDSCSADSYDDTGEYVPMFLDSKDSSSLY